MAAILIREPDGAEFEMVKNYAKEYWLDDEGVDKKQFKVLLYDNKLAAFGRIKEHKDSTELCTIGVVEKYRGKKLGEALVKGFISGIKHDVYLVTVIPSFFHRMGFMETTKYPQSIREKTDRCGTKYHVDESYTVMKYSPQTPL
jgi:N-acetylglutamate synthase-like GNAT family acetyltransferase